MMTELKGCSTALVTPFKADGSVDYEAYAALVDRQVEAGVDFLTVLATTAETPALSAEEKLEILRIARAHSGGVPLLVGCGSNSVPGTKANMDFIGEENVDAWLVVVPFYNKPTQEGQYQYFKAVAALTSKPVVIYNVPGRTGANMSAETCLRLANDVSNIIATKEASGKIEQMAAIAAGAPEGFSVLSGDDDITEAAMEKGCKGVISVASNIAPAEVKAMVDAALAGDFGKARSMSEALMPLFHGCFVESNPIPVKAGLSHMGLCTPCMRLPLTEATEDTKKIMKDTLSELWK